jgi:hypothetical protein
MAGLDPAIHVFGLGQFDAVDARNKCGHDALKGWNSSRLGTAYVAKLSRAIYVKP